MILVAERKAEWSKSRILDQGQGRQVGHPSGSLMNASGLTSMRPLTLVSH